MCKGTTFLRLSGIVNRSGSLWELARFDWRLCTNWELFLDFIGILCLELVVSMAFKVEKVFILVKRWEFFVGLPFTYFLFISTKLPVSFFLFPFLILLPLLELGVGGAMICSPILSPCEGLLVLGPSMFWRALVLLLSLKLMWKPSTEFCAWTVY